MPTEATPVMTREAPTLKKYFGLHAADDECQTATQTVSHPASCYSFDWEGIFIRTAPTDGVIRKAVHVQSCACIMYLPSHPALAGHPTGDVCTRLILGANGKLYIPSCLELALMHLEGVSRKDQEERPALLRRRTPRVCSHLGLRTADGDQDRKSICRYIYRPDLEVDLNHPYSQDQFHAKLDNNLKQLDRAMWNTFIII